MAEIELRRIAAKEKRYQKALVRDLNIAHITETLADMAEACGDVRYFVDGADESLLNDLIGSEDEAFEFRMMFSMLLSDIESMQEDINETYNGVFSYQKSQDFDDFFVSINAAIMGGGMLGFDPEEKDYFPLRLSFENELAVSTAAKRLKRLTKKQIIDAAQFSFFVAFNYIGIKTRYENLKGAIDILRGENAGFLQQIKSIEAAYEAAEKAEFRDFQPETRKFEQLIEQLPDESWIQ